MARLKWTIEIEVDEVWVADGFDLTPDSVKDRVANMLPHASDSEFDARVLKAPSAAAVAKVQGY